MGSGAPLNPTRIFRTPDPSKDLMTGLRFIPNPDLQSSQAFLGTMKHRYLLELLTLIN